jgi:hypothetical protein
VDLGQARLRGLDPGFALSMGIAEQPADFLWRSASIEKGLDHHTALSEKPLGLIQVPFAKAQAKFPG